MNNKKFYLILTIWFFVLFPSKATILTFEDLSANNLDMSGITNPFGAGQYGSRASSAINAGFQQGDGWTPDVALTWGTGWQTYSGWPLGNDAQNANGKVTQADFDVSGRSPLRITFTPNSSVGVLIKSFSFLVWSGSPATPVQIRWSVYGGTASSNNLLATGLSQAIGTSGGVQIINTGLTAPHLGSTPVILQWEIISGDGTYIAMNNLHFVQGLARQIPALTWAAPEPILSGTALGSSQLNATASVAGAFVYTPASGTVLPAGTNSLRVDFTPSDTNAYTTAFLQTSILVKSNNVPVITFRPRRKVGTNEALGLNLFETANDVAGNFTFSPGSGTLLPIGTNLVSFSFNPSNSIWATVTGTVSVVVVPFVPEGTVWDFSNRLEAIFGSAVLSFHDPATNGWPNEKIRFGTASGFGLPLPYGGDSSVMAFSHNMPAEGFKVQFSDPPNGVYLENGFLSNYTLIFDVLFPTNGGIRPLFNSNAANSTGPEAFITAGVTSAVQVAGISYGEIRANVWHRIAIVIRSATAEGQAHIYVDGTFVGAIGSNDTLISGAYALDRLIYLLTSGNGNGGSGYLSGLRFVGRNLDYVEVNALGGVHADGPHVAGLPAPRPPFYPLRDVIIIGHRGEGGLAPEDTLPSFLRAFDSGADVVEIDLRRTSDNRVVSMHDPTIDRTTDRSGSVVTMTLAQVQAADAGSWFSPVYENTPPPALREIMAATVNRTGILYLDLKVNGMASLIKTDADATGFPYDRIWFWVYDQPAEAEAYRAVFPNAKIIWGEGNWSDGAGIGSWPSLSPEQKQSVVAGMKARGVYGFDFGDNEATSLNPTTLQELRANGFFVSCYSALHPRSMTSAINYLEVDGMETDFPIVLRNLMPTYTVNAVAKSMSDTRISLSWTPFTNPEVSELRIRAKRKASPTWISYGAISPTNRYFEATGLGFFAAHEVQVIGYSAAGIPIQFGNVAEANTLAFRSNFTNAYTRWQTNFAGTGTYLENPDQDAFINLLEYAFSLNPTNADVQLNLNFSVRMETNQIVLSYGLRTNTLVRLRLQSSSDLNSWTNLFEGLDYTVSIETIAGRPDLRRNVFRRPRQSALEFLRLVVEPVL